MSITTTNTLVKATELLIEAAVKESALQLTGASKEAISELKAIRASLDRMSQEQTLQARNQSIQTGLLLAETISFTYFGEHNGFKDVASTEFIREVLMNALQGVATRCSTSDGFLEDPAAKDHMGRMGAKTNEAFRKKLASHIHGLTGIKPTLELSHDGKSYLIKL